MDLRIAGYFYERPRPASPETRRMPLNPLLRSSDQPDPFGIAEDRIDAPKHPTPQVGGCTAAHRGAAQDRRHLHLTQAAVDER